MRSTIFWVWMMAAAVWMTVGISFAVKAYGAGAYREPTTREIVLAIRDLERRVEKLENGE